jgi:hypothetical protein
MFGSASQFAKATAAARWQLMDLADLAFGCLLASTARIGRLRAKPSPG